MSKQEIPKYPTHAVKMIDNSAGDEDVLFLFAYKVDGVFYSYDTNKILIEFSGDRILSAWDLDT